MRRAENYACQSWGQNQTNHKSKYFFLAKLRITKVTGFSTLAECKNTDHPDESWSEGLFYI
jgi:hypothetical protein